MEVKGHGGTVVRFDGAAVTIQRKGALARMTVGKGEKRLPIASITAVQWKPAGSLTNGFIQFTIGGGAERRSQFGRQTTDAAKDENSVIFSKKQMPEFEKLRDEIQEAIDAHHTPQQAAAPDIADQLQKLGTLRESGVLTEDEFQAKKADLLGRL